MLKLEKIRKTRDISVSVRQKAPFFNGIFWIALLWAIAIHAFGLLVFHIAPFKINYNDSIFPPVAVASDLDRAFQDNALAYMDEEIVVPPYLLLPQTQLTLAPKVPDVAAAKKFGDYSARLNGVNPFLSIELSCLTHGNCWLGPAPAAPVKIHVSGSLAAFQWQSPQMEIAPLLKLQKKDYHLVFDVMVDSKTGHIFWFQPKDKMPAALVVWSEEVLKNMYFQITSSEVAAGKVEILLQLSTNEKL